MVNVVVVRVVAGEALQWVEREAVPAMVVDALHGGEEEEEHGFARGHPREDLCEPRSDGLEHEALDGVVVGRTERVGHV